MVSTSRCGRDNPGSNPGHGRESCCGTLSWHVTLILFQRVWGSFYKKALYKFTVIIITVIKVTRPLWLLVLAGQHGHTVMVLSIGVHDVYLVITCRPGRGHIVAAARVQLVTIENLP